MKALLITITLLLPLLAVRAEERPAPRFFCDVLGAFQNCRGQG